MKPLAILILSLILSLPGLAQAASMARSSPQVKSDSLRYLQDLRTENARRLKDVDESLRKTVEEGNGELAQNVSKLKAQQKEHRLRQDFLDRLIGQIDAHFSGGDLRAFLEPTLKEMAKIDAVSSDSGLYVFLRYASEAIAKLPEQKENVLSFLEGYMSRSVSNPIPAREYIAARNYTNGSKSEAGNPVDREEVGAIADRRLQELKDKAAVTASAAGAEKP